MSHKNIKFKPPAPSARYNKTLKEPKKKTLNLKRSCNNSSKPSKHKMQTYKNSPSTSKICLIKTLCLKTNSRKHKSTFYANMKHKSTQDSQFMNKIFLALEDKIRNSKEGSGNSNNKWRNLSGKSMNYKTKMKTSDDKENKPKFKWSRNSKLKPPNKLTFTNSKSRKSKPNSEMHKNKTKNFTAD